MQTLVGVGAEGRRAGTYTGGFEVINRRWVVERTLVWIWRKRWMSRYYDEHLP